jgi:CheY-like chemotaxis protein
VLLETPDIIYDARVTSLPCVLVVEDDAAIRKMIVSALQRQPLVVDSAVDGVTALAKLQSTAYAVLLVDLMMPRMNGFAFLDALARLALPNPPMVMVMTAFDNAVLRQLDANVVHACIRKPFDMQVFIELVCDCAESMSRASHIAAGRSIGDDISGVC